MDTNHLRSGCPVVFSLDLFGDRWTLLVIRDMAMFGRTTYSEFLAAGEGISTNILADRLRRLEEQGVVTKERDPDHGARFRYRLTEKGLDLIPVLVQMLRFGARHDPNSPVPKAFRRRLEKDPEGLAAELRERAKAGSKR